MIEYPLPSYPFLGHKRLFFHIMEEKNVGKFNDDFYFS